MITEYEIRVIRSWQGVKNGQLLKVNEQRAHHLVRGGFAELVQKADAAAAKPEQIRRKRKIPDAD